MKYKIVLGIIFIVMLSFSMSYAQSGVWYPGKGVQQGLLVKYRVSELDLTKGETVVLTVWFKDRDADGNWNTYMILEEKNKIVDGWIRLSPNNLAPIGFSDDPDMDIAINIFKKTLIWINSFSSSQSPTSLSVGSILGRLGVIGGVDIKISRQESVEAPAGKTWDTSVVTWIYGRESNIWLSESFPLPIKALTYASTTQEPIPILFKFDLVENRITDIQPEPPIKEVELPEPPLRSPSTSRQYIIELWWRPAVIQPGETIKIAPVIKNAATNAPLQNVKYNITITDANNNKILHEEVVAPDGTSTHEVVFNEGGNYKVSIVLAEATALGGVTGNIGIVERAEFNIIVIPEFPIGAIIAMTSVVAIIIIMSRFKQGIPKI